MRQSEVRGWVLYDDHCGICRRWVPFWASTLRSVGLAIAPLQSPWIEARLRLAPDVVMADLRLLLADGRQIIGADVYRDVMRSLWWAYPLYLLSIAPGLRWVFNRAYRAFADHRRELSEMCHLPGPVGPDPRAEERPRLTTR